MHCSWSVAHGVPASGSGVGQPAGVCHAPKAHSPAVCDEASAPASVDAGAVQGTQKPRPGGYVHLTPTAGHGVSFVASLMDAGHCDGLPAQEGSGAPTVQAFAHSAVLAQWGSLPYSQKVEGDSHGAPASGSVGGQGEGPSASLASGRGIEASPASARAVEASPVSLVGTAGPLAEEQPTTSVRKSIDGTAK